MKNNTQDLKTFLVRALNSTPNDFALQDVRFHISKAISVVEGVEKKRNIREQQRLARQTTNSTPILGATKDLLNLIDQQINAEREKLEEIKNRKATPKTLANSDNDGLDYVFG